MKSTLGTKIHSRSECAHAVWTHVTVDSGGMEVLMYCFDEHIDRKGTSDLKWNAASAKSMLGADMDADTIPMWIADMDFRCPPCITEVLTKRVSHGIFGYCVQKEDYFNALVWWQKQRSGWEIRPEWIVPAPGVVPAINVAIRAFTPPGGNVIIQPPVYDPFKETVEKTGRVVVNNPLILENGHYEMDFVGLERLASDQNTNLLILCSPHNPVGRVWTESELSRLCDICLRHQVRIISDEIHSDLIFDGYRHIPLGSLNEGIKNNCIVCTAPSKTFNVPGLKCSNIIIPNLDLRNSFTQMRNNMDLKINSTMAVEVLPAAYSTQGEVWLKDVLKYLQENVAMVGEFLKERIPGIRLIWPEGTFLVWLDCTGLNMEEQELMDRLNHKANLIMIAGSWFGKEGTCYLRFNIAHPRDVVREALLRMESVLG